MPFSKKLGECLCERCEHWWKPKPINGEYFEPKSCAGCKSKVWNQPRKYQGNYPFLIVTRREKPTGRLAASLRPEKIRAERLDDLKSRLRFVNYEINKTLDDLAEPDHRKFDRNALGYYYKTFTEERDRLKEEIKNLELTPTNAG